MIIIGSKYKLNNIEIDKLKNKYQLIFIDYNQDSSTQETINQVKEFLPLNSSKIIVINIEAINSKLSNFLKELDKYKIITIEYFLENYLQKLYLSPAFLADIKPYTKWQYIQKKSIDFIITIPLAILSSPIMLYSIYRIKKESPKGTIFFQQIRVGKDNIPFKCYKFRSMHTETKFFNHYTQDEDPRVFKWGKFMRKSRVDELPQLLNVLKGDMHVIGPRAEWIDLVKDYEKQLPNYHKRHKVAPGITGWAQVNYPYGRNLEDTRQKLMYDLYYIKNWNLWLEIKVVFKTIAVVLGKKGI